MDQGIIGDNRAEDIRWLHSLSESELDLLVSLKTLVLQRAKVVRRDSLAQKFDLKMLRALGFILMQYIKHKLNESPLTGLNGSEDLLRGLNLLKLDLMNIDQCTTSDCETPHIKTYKKKRYRRVLLKSSRRRKRARNAALCT